MPAAQTPLRCVLHHQKGSSIGDTKIENAHNMRMNEMRDELRFPQKGLQFIWLNQARLQNLDGRPDAEQAMLCQIYLGKAALAQETDQSIVAYPLPAAVSHEIPLSSLECALSECPFQYGGCSSLM